MAGRHHSGWPPSTIKPNGVWLLVPYSIVCKAKRFRNRQKILHFFQRANKSNAGRHELSNSPKHEAKAGQTNAHLSSFCSRQVPNLRWARFTEEAQRLSTTWHAEQYSHGRFDKVREPTSQTMSIRYHVLFSN